MPAGQCVTTRPKQPTRGRALPQKLPPIVRDLVILVAGTYGFFHELLRTGPERPLYLFASMAALGLPLALRADERD